MTKALCLSGGGARGGFQVGVLRAMQELGIQPDVGFGISTGALNITFAMSGEIDRLTHVWRDIKDADIHKQYSGFGLAWRLVAGRHRGIHDNAPLLGTIERNIAEPPPANAYVGWTDLTTGAYHCGPATRTNIYASATMPIVWEPVGGRYADGGLRNQTAIGDAAEYGADRIIAVLCRPRGIRDQEWRPQGRVLLVPDVLRTIEIMSDEIAEGDIRETCRINELLDAGKSSRSPSGRAHRKVELTVIRPERWIGDTLSFNQLEIRQAIAHGHAVGLKALKRFDQAA